MKHFFKKFVVSLLVLAFLVPNTGCIFEPDYIEVQVEESIFEGKYYYQKYDDSKKQIYREIKKFKTRSLK